MILIGLEVHVQLNTKTKLFCACSTNFKDEGKPNTNTCPTCLGMPGAKPSFNRGVFEKALAVSLALNGTISSEMFFSRKTYFYPDMPKNFQTTQYELPISQGGYLIIKVDGKDKKIRLRRVHIEEDPGKLVHVGGDITHSKYTLVDYNRSGLPLVEIVTEPDLSTPAQAREFMQKLRSILQHLGVYEDSFVMKADANVSIHGGNRVEIKNITGAKNIEKALLFEISRQKMLYERKTPIEQHTRHFNAASGITKSLRTKEEEADYGYIFEPDLPLYDINKKAVADAKRALPELPDVRISRFVKDLALNRDVADALVLVDKALADFFEATFKHYKNAQNLANWTATFLLKSLHYQKKTIAQVRITPQNFAKLLSMLETGEITNKVAKEVLKTDEFLHGESPKTIVETKGWKTLSDEKALTRAVDKAMKAHQKAVADIKAGQDKAVNFLLGQVLRELGVSADLDKVRQLILERARK
ncbi:Asp-tRNA(Asn)/Glu-tRNA(Gln) amidotransferase GatCAB subunit B [archaeon CG10_big_fil_rev_8_21_14_0_10_43_11]|nr:MAG: Asp-tRNA(Asn)/Glu-tRNA(Gln) amidotransferase GatCAB subunit B [archaeon CG10_big_fil_rev_8_21_14_0_10_43_11]